MITLATILSTKKKGEYKSVFASGDKDHALINESVNWSVLSDISVEVESDMIFTSGTPIAIFSKGAFNSAGSGLVYINKISATRGSIYRSGISAANEIVTEFDLADGLSTVRLHNLELSVGGIVLLTLPELTVDLAVSVVVSTIGKLSYSNIWYGMDLHRYMFDGEEFANNESSGVTRKSDGSTTSTVLTSHVDGLKHINNTVTKRIG